MLLFFVTLLSLVLQSLASKVVCKQSPRPVGFQCNESFSQRTQKITNKGNSTFFNRVKNNLFERFLQLSFLTFFQVFAARDRFVLLHHFRSSMLFLHEKQIRIFLGANPIKSDISLKRQIQFQISSLHISSFQAQVLYRCILN